MAQCQQWNVSCTSCEETLHFLNHTLSVKKEKTHSSFFKKCFFCNSAGVSKVAVDKLSIRWDLSGSCCIKLVREVKCCSLYVLCLYFTLHVVKKACNALNKRSKCKQDFGRTFVLSTTKTCVIFDTVRSNACLDGFKNYMKWPNKEAIQRDESFEGKTFPLCVFSSS